MSAIKMGTLADWVGGVGTMAAVVWAVRQSKTEARERETSALREMAEKAAQQSYRRATEAAKISVRLTLRPLALLPHLSDHEQAALRTWEHEMRTRGYEKRNDRWNQPHGDSLSAEQLMTEHPAGIREPWQWVAEMSTSAAIPCKVLAKCSSASPDVEWADYLSPGEVSSRRIGPMAATKGDPILADLPRNAVFIAVFDHDDDHQSTLLPIRVNT